MNATTILTAAHCISPEENGEKIVLDKILSENDEPVEITPTQYIPHPEYKNQYWHNYDLGIIKTSINKKFAGAYQLETTDNVSTGIATLYGCGKIDPSHDVRARTTGDNNFLRLGSILFFVGASVAGSDVGHRVSIAPNDSGGPVADLATGKIIGVSVTTTVKQSRGYGLPALSTATSTVTPDNLKFILQHLD